MARLMGYEQQICRPRFAATTWFSCLLRFAFSDLQTHFTSRKSSLHEWICSFSFGLLEEIVRCSNRVQTRMNAAVLGDHQQHFLVRALSLENKNSSGRVSCYGKQ